MDGKLVFYDCSKCGQHVGWFKHLAEKSDGQCMNCAFKSVTLRRRVTQPAIAPVSVTCEVCGNPLDKRGGSKTCSPKCRKALSRRQQRATLLA